jgi:ABC-2 type transport system permease protein
VAYISQPRAALLVAAADLRRRLRNRSFLIQALVGPIVLAGIISLAFGSGSGFEATIGVVDADGSPMAEQFVTGVTGADAGDLEFVRVGSADEARTKVDDGDLGAAVVVPGGFTASLQTDTPGDLDVITSSDNVVSAEVARAVASGFTDRANAARLAATATAALGAPVPSADALAAIELPVHVETTGTGGDVSPAAYFGPAMGLLFLFLSMGAVARDLLTEKRIGLLDRVRSGPVRDAAILAGKGLSVLVIGTTSLLVIWAVTAVWLGADWGDPVGVVLLIVAAALAVAGIAGFIAGVARTEQSADTLATVAAFVFALIGGAFIPPGDLPDALQRLTLLTPTGWALRGFAELSAGNGGVADIVPHMLALLAWGLAAGLVAARLLPRRLGAR